MPVRGCCRGHRPSALRPLLRAALGGAQNFLLRPPCRQGLTAIRLFSRMDASPGGRRWRSRRGLRLRGREVAAAADAVALAEQQQLPTSGSGRSALTLKLVPRGPPPRRSRALDGIPFSGGRLLPGVPSALLLVLVQEGHSIGLEVRNASRARAHLVGLLWRAERNGPGTVAGASAHV